MAPIFEQTSEWNLIIALLIGIAFGWVLERAGFSTSRKLAVVFYGYDFVVIKVFFTAAITASLGLLFLNYFGVLDFSKVWMPTTFLWSTIVGGIIMGLGFILGGFCPGTSVCAVATGKIDALAFVVGITLGIFFYSFTYEYLWEDFREYGNIGNVKIGELIGVTEGVAVLIFILFGLFAFWLVDKIKKEYNIKDVEY
jgi:uncharacterized membrane protein YedE/YeeE